MPSEAATSTGRCPDHRETYADGSPRGDKYPDDRTPLALVYDGLSLRATVYDEREVERYRETRLTVRLTPAGECRIEGRCRASGGVEDGE